jgi:hypothetical protein
MFSLMSNADINRWKAWFDIHGFAEERADMRMLLTCAVAGQVKEAMEMVQDYMRQRSGGEIEKNDDQRIMSMFKAMG